MNFILKICIISILALATKASAGGPESLSNFDSALQAGIKNYQEKHFDLSIVELQKAVEMEPKNVFAMTNLALAQFQNGQKSLALAWLRRVLSLDPDFPTAQSAYEFILQQLEVKEIPHEILWKEALHARVLSTVSQFWFSCLAALFIFAAGWTMLGYFGSLKKSKLQGTVPPSLSFLLILFTSCAVLFSALLIFKVIDQTQIRGTLVTSEKVSVLSSPDEKAPALFELYPGLEVIIEKTIENSQTQWVQINYPGGPTGWLPKTNIMITTEN